MSTAWRRTAADGRLAALEDRVEQLEGLVAAMQRRRRVGTPSADARLLSAVAGSFGGAIFSSDDLQTSRDPELRAAIGTVDARVVGAWLRRLRAHPVPPYVLRRVKRDGGGMLWAVDVGDGQHTRPSIRTDSRTR